MILARTLRPLVRFQELSFIISDRRERKRERTARRFAENPIARKRLFQQSIESVNDRALTMSYGNVIVNETRLPIDSESKMPIKGLHLFIQLYFFSIAMSSYLNKTGLNYEF